MVQITNFTRERLDALNLDPADYAWVLDQLEAIHIAFENCPWTKDPDRLHTQKQVGFLSGVMDLERKDRIAVMEIILGRPLHWDLDDDFPGAVPEEDMEHPEEYPGPSLKDIGITIWMNSFLIDYYINGDGLELNNRLGFTSQEAIRQAKRIARRIAQQAKTSTSTQSTTDR